MGARGEVVQPLDEAALRAALARLQDGEDRGADGLADQCVRQRRARAAHPRDRRGGAAGRAGVALLGSRAGDAGIRAHRDDGRELLRAAARAKYVHNLHDELERAGRAVKLHILRSDGGLASAERAEAFPVNLLMSGPAGGVTGALWVALQAGFPNLLTVDVGGTSTDVALIKNGVPRLRRETTRRRRHGARLVGRHPHGRRRRRLDRPRAGADQGVARRTAIARAPSPGRPPTAAAARSRR